jgi:hypothetical protein
MRKEIVVVFYCTSHSKVNRKPPPGFMVTRDVVFCDNMYSYIQNLMKKSTLISTVSERERTRFVKYLRQKIANRKLSLKV